MEELLTVQKYASLYRLSTHAVIKKTMSGELQTLTKEKNGKEVTYILNPESKTITTEAPCAKSDINEECEIGYKKAYEDLHKQYLILKTKYEKLIGN